jgi:hypothetical protein
LMSRQRWTLLLGIRSLSTLESMTLRGVVSICTSRFVTLREVKDLKEILGDHQLPLSWQTDFARRYKALSSGLPPD